MHILNANRCGKKKDGNQTVTPFSFYIYFLGSNIIMCKVRFNIGAAIKHFIITCTEFNYIRNRYFTAKTVKELFSDTSSDKIIDFLKETNLFNKL